MFWKSSKKRSKKNKNWNATKWWSPGSEEAITFTDAPKDSYHCNFDEYKVIVANDSSITGRLTFNSPVRIDGNVDGECYSTSSIIVGPNAKVDAKIICQDLIIYGQVRSEVKASGQVVIYNAGELKGPVVCRSLCFPQGAFYSGDCTMTNSAGVAQSAGTIASSAA